MKKIKVTRYIPICDVPSGNGAEIFSVNNSDYVVLDRANVENRKVVGRFITREELDLLKKDSPTLTKIPTVESLEFIIRSACKDFPSRLVKRVAKETRKEIEKRNKRLETYDFGSPVEVEFVS